MGYYPLAIVSWFLVDFERRKFLNVLRARMQRLNIMMIYTVYFNPRDFPGLYVMRPFVPKGEIAEPMGIAWTGKTLDEVRAKIPRDLGLVCVPRASQDHPSVVEVWI